MALKLGIHAVQQDCTYEELRRVWRLADSSGFYAASVWDHFYQHPWLDGRGGSFEAVSIMTALAAETKNVRVGCEVFCMGYRHPAVLAKAAVTMDHVSNGRLELGIGAGWYEKEHHAFGIPFPPVGVRLDILEESVQIIKSMLTNESTTFKGRYFQVTDALCFPRPVQKPPRIWVGGGGEHRTLRIVARYADGWNVPLVSPQELRRKMGVLGRWCEREGRDPAQITRTINLGFYMGADQASARRIRREFDEKFGPLAERRREGALFGTAREVVDQIGEYVDAGAQGLNIAVRAPFDWDALHCFIEDVMPAFA